MLLPGRIIGLNSIIRDALVLHYLKTGLSRGEIRDLVPIAQPTLVERILCIFLGKACPTELIPP
jgi:hypothetical protein